MPSRKPQTLNNTIELTGSGGLPRDCISCAQALFKTTPLVMNSTKLITTPANKLPKITRPRLVWAIRILLGGTENCNAQNDGGIMACLAAVGNHKRKT